MAANDSNPQCQDCIKSFVHHSVTNPHLYMHSLTTSLPYRRPCSTFHDIPSDTFMSISKQNVENNSPKKPIKRSFLSTLLQMPPQRKLPSLERKQKNVDNIEQISDEPNLLKKDKNQFAKAFEIKESVENDSKNLKNLQEVLLDIYLTDSEQPFEKLTLQKEIGTLKNLKSSETTINYSNNSSISLSKNEADIQELQRKITEIYFDVLIDSDAPKRISNIPAELSVNKYLEKMSCEEYSDTPVNDLLISKTDETKEFQTTDLKDKKNPAKRNVKLISQNYCNYTNTVDYGTMVSQATNFIPFTLKAIAELAFNKIKIDFCESERSLLKQIPLIVTNDKENDIKNRGSEFRVTFVTSDSSEIEEDSEMLSNVSPIFRAIIDASDKNDCKIDTNFNFETVSRALNYLHDSDEKYLQGYENEIYQFAEEYFIDFLKVSKV
uniref:C2H2-type domain-containing protein n=1 Tax=Panagrolaimus superbus TaxID=310955 RepID=A0A914Y1G6_9BILA